MLVRYLEYLIISFCVWFGKYFRYVEKQAAEKQVALLTNERFLKGGVWMYLFCFILFVVFIKKNLHVVFIELIL